jgi:lipid II:glycine glycyltransferase (peptidoglycan interpeptide bridge formation enzyme)
MMERGYAAIRCERTYLYIKKTFLGKIGQVFYPMRTIETDESIKYLEVRGLLEPLPNATSTDYTNTVHIDLRRTSDEICKSLQKNKRWGVRKALERGAQAYCGETKACFDEFWGIYKATAKRKEIHVMPRKILERIFNEKEICKLFLVESRSKIIGAYMVLHSDELARFFYGGFLYEFKDYHPNELGHYTIIENLRERGLKIYDMGGTGKFPKKGDFKVGWGKIMKIYECRVYDSKFFEKAVEYYRKTELLYRKFFRR